MEVQVIVDRQKEFFKSKKTKDIAFRKASLKRLLEELVKREKDIAKAMYNDFRKPEFESVMTETGIVINELKLAIRKVNSWAKSQYVLPVLVNFPSTNRIYREPYGTVLIIAPWNYPFQLVFSPLIGAIAAGNTVVIKPSEHSAHTSRIVSEIISAVFDPGHVTVIEGEVAVAARLLRERWDYIFFTGSIAVGKIVAKAAAEHLTPATLELGGKNPCIVDETAVLRLAAKRIIWGNLSIAVKPVSLPTMCWFTKVLRMLLWKSAKKKSPSLMAKMLSNRLIMQGLSILIISKLCNNCLLVKRCFLAE